MPLRLTSRFRAYRNVLDAMIRNVDDRPGLPRAAHLIPTWRCDLRCRTCQVWRRADESEELDTGQWVAMAEKLKCLDIVKIVGGEPFAREDLEEICMAFWERVDPFILQITTAGSRTEQIIRFAERCGRPGLNLRISLDGLEESYIRMRGVPDVYERVLETLKACAALAKKRGFTVGVNFCLTDESVDDLPEVMRLCRELGVDCVPGIAVQPFLEHVQDWSTVEHKVLMVKDPAKIQRAMDSTPMGYTRGLGPIARVFMRRSNQDIFTDRLSHREAHRFRCREIRNLAYVLPNGDMVICGLRYDPVGNLRESTVKEIWRSERAEELRRVVDQCPGCHQSSTEIMSRLYCGNF